jgi:hypothetical protein
MSYDAWHILTAAFSLAAVLAFAAWSAWLGGLGR